MKNLSSKTKATTEMPENNNDGTNALDLAVQLWKASGRKQPDKATAQKLAANVVAAYAELAKAEKRVVDAKELCYQAAHGLALNYGKQAFTFAELGEGTLSCRGDKIFLKFAQKKNRVTF